MLKVRLRLRCLALLGRCAPAASAVDILVAAALVDRLEGVGGDHPVAVEQLVELHAVVLVVAVLAGAVAHAIADDHALQIYVSSGGQDVVGDVRDEPPAVGLACGQDRASLRNSAPNSGE